MAEYLEKEEIEKIESLIKSKGLGIGWEAVTPWNSMFKIWGVMSRDGDPIERFKEIASQEKWEPIKTSCGDHKFREDLYFADGLEKNVFTNLLRALGYGIQSINKIASIWIIPCLMVSKAMKVDERVDIFVRSIVSGAEKVREKNEDYLWTYEDGIIYDILKRFID